MNSFNAYELYVENENVDKEKKASDYVVKSFESILGGRLKPFKIGRAHV